MRPQRRRQRLFMRHQKQGRSGARVQRKEEVGHVGARLSVEIAGRFVGEENARARRDGAGERDTLLFAAGKLSRIMVEARAQTDRLQFGLRAVESIARARKLKRHGHVLKRRHGGNQMKGLEDDADMVAAEARQRVFAHAREVGARDGHATDVGASRPAATISSEDLPDPDGPSSATVSPAATINDTPARMLTGPAALDSVSRHVFQIDGGCGILRSVTCGCVRPTGDMA